MAFSLPLLFLIVSITMNDSIIHSFGETNEDVVMYVLA